MKKKLLSIFLLLGLVLLMLPSVNAAEAIHYVALGDSIAAGYGLEGYSYGGEAPADSYIAKVAKALGSETKLVNLARSGSTTQDLLDALETSEYQDAIKEADYITISIGSNDLVKVSRLFIYQTLGVTPMDDDEKIGGTIFWNLATRSSSALTQISEALNSSRAQDLYKIALESYENNWDSILEQIHELNPDAKIVATSFYDPYAGNPDPYGIFYTIRSQIDKYNAYLESDAQSGGYTVAELGEIEVHFSLNTEHLELSNLDTHPTAEGHTQITDAVLSALSI